MASSRSSRLSAAEQYRREHCNGMIQWLRRNKCFVDKDPTHPSSSDSLTHTLLNGACGGRVRVAPGLHLAFQTALAEALHDGALVSVHQRATPDACPFFVDLDFKSPRALSQDTLLRIVREMQQTILRFYRRQHDGSHEADEADDDDDDDDDADNLNVADTLQAVAVARPTKVIDPPPQPNMRLAQYLSDDGGDQPPPQRQRQPNAHPSTAATAARKKPHTKKKKKKRDQNDSSSSSASSSSSGSSSSSDGDSDSEEERKALSGGLPTPARRRRQTLQNVSRWCKQGVHIVFPRLLVSLAGHDADAKADQHVYFLREACVAHLQRLFPRGTPSTGNSWRDVVDEQVYTPGQGGLRMAGTSKVKACKACAKHKRTAERAACPVCEGRAVFEPASEYQALAVLDGHGMANARLLQALQAPTARGRLRLLRATNLRVFASRVTPGFAVFRGCPQPMLPQRGDTVLRRTADGGVFVARKRDVFASSRRLAKNATPCDPVTSGYARALLAFLRRAPTTPAVYRDSTLQALTLHANRGGRTRFTFVLDGEGSTTCLNLQAGHTHACGVSVHGQVDAQHGLVFQCRCRSPTTSTRVQHRKCADYRSPPVALDRLAQQQLFDATAGRASASGGALVRSNSIRARQTLGSPAVVAVLQNRHRLRETQRTRHRLLLQFMAGLVRRRDEPALPPGPVDDEAAAAARQRHDPSLTSVVVKKKKKKKKTTTTPRKRKAPLAQTKPKKKKKTTTKKKKKAKKKA